MPRSLSTFFAGFSSPNYTQVPDELFDQLMPQLSDAELRVLLYIMRRTFGFKRDTDAISLSQMVSGITTKDGKVLDRGTGLSKATVARGLAGLRDKGVILAERNASLQRGDEPTTYRLRFAAESSEVPPDVRTPVSQPRDTLPVSPARHPVSQPRDTQETARQETDFEHSKGNLFVDKSKTGRVKLDPSRAQPDQSGSPVGMTSIAIELNRRTRPTPGGEDRAAIAATIGHLAEELGDRANPNVSVARAMNLFAATGVHRDVFIDALYQAKGEVQDRRRYPGKAPLPRNPMAYFFAVVEDKFGRSTSDRHQGK